MVLRPVDSKAITSTIKDPASDVFLYRFGQNPCAIHIVQAALRMIDEIRELEQ